MRRRLLRVLLPAACRRRRRLQEADGGAGQARPPHKRVHHQRLPRRGADDVIELGEGEAAAPHDPDRDVRGAEAALQREHHRR